MVKNSTLEESVCAPPQSKYGKHLSGILISHHGWIFLKDLWQLVVTPYPPALNWAPVATSLQKAHRLSTLAPDCPRQQGWREAAAWHRANSRNCEQE